MRARWGMYSRERKRGLQDPQAGGGLDSSLSLSSPAALVVNGTTGLTATSKQGGWPFVPLSQQRLGVGGEQLPG